MWRFGADAANEAISSYAVLDVIVRMLLDQSIYPNIKLLTVVGHSSGGQTVQRYSLSTVLAPENRLRFVIANPSSFAYLDSNRWLDQGKATERLAQPPHSVVQSCPGYNEWEWGFASGGEHTSYVLSDPATIRRYISQYAIRDVRCVCAQIIVVALTHKLQRQALGRLDFDARLTSLGGLYLTSCPCNVQLSDRRL